MFHVVVPISFQDCAKTTYCIFAGGLHDLAEPNADSLPLVTLVRAQSILQDGNYFWENLFSQFSHQISKSTSRNLKKQSKRWQKVLLKQQSSFKKNDTNNLYSVYFYAMKERYRSLIRTGGSQKAQQQSEERWEDLTKSSGGVGNYNLPHVEGSLSNYQLSV